MLGGEPKLSSGESSWFFRRYSNTSHRRRVQNKERSSPLAVRTFPPFTSLRPFATVCRGWQGHRASVIRVSPHDFVPQPIKQRRVYRVAIGYAIVAWLMVQIAATVLPAFHAPEFVLPVLIVLLGVGFPVALVLAWAFDVTPSGIEKTPEGTGTSAARNMRYAWALAGLGLLIAAVGVGAYWFWHRPVTKRTAEISYVVFCLTTTR